MKTNEVVARVQSLGYGVRIRDDGTPALIVGEGPNPPHPAILRQLARHRDKILAARLAESAPNGAVAVQDTGRNVEVRFGTGLVERHWLPSGFPFGALEWREPGTAEWAPVPEKYRREARDECLAAVRSWKPVDESKKCEPPY